MADFQNCLTSRIFGVCSSRFLHRPTLVFLKNVFSHVLFLTQTYHFAKDIAFAWAIAFAKLAIFKVVLFLEYLEFFEPFFCTQQLYCSCIMFFRMFLEFLTFDPN